VYVGVFVESSSTNTPIIYSLVERKHEDAIPLSRDTEESLDEIINVAIFSTSPSQIPKELLDRDWVFVKISPLY
jgi:hypothetical protein